MENVMKNLGKVSVVTKTGPSPKSGGSDTDGLFYFAIPGDPNSIVLCSVNEGGNDATCAGLQ